MPRCNHLIQYLTETGKGSGFLEMMASIQEHSVVTSPMTLKNKEKDGYETENM